MGGSEDGRVIRSAALWGTILNVGGVLLVTGTLGYAAVTIQAYEERCGPVADCAPSRVSDTMETAQSSAQNVDAVDAMPQGPGQDAVSNEATPEGTEPAITDQVEQLSKDLIAAQSKLAEADTTNAALQNRISTLEQQLASQNESASAAAQCKSELSGIHDRYNRIIDRIRSNSERTQQELNACRQQSGQPITG